MNKLEQYRDIKKQKIAEEVQHPQIQRQRGDCYEEGFNQALSLDLPVKFAEFIRTNCGIGNNILYYKMKPITEQELYQYWIENIYKPE